LLEISWGRVPASSKEEEGRIYAYVSRATPGDAQVALSWTGFSDALSGIPNYVYSGPDTSIPPHTGLINGTTYGYRICATDGAGNTSTGATATARPVSAPWTSSLFCELSFKISHKKQLI